MAKLSYNQVTGLFQVTERGRVIDCDKDFDALAIRQGFVSDEDEDEDEELENEE